MQKILEVILGIIFPKRCAGCGSYGALICDECLVSIPRADVSIHPFITTLFDYQNKTIQNAIWRFKYKNARGFAKYFGEQLYQEIIGDLGDGLHISKNKTFLLVPIPLHKKRMHDRGYNQSELIAREILKEDNSHIFDLAPKALVRVRETKSQARSDKRASRLENLRGAFQADSSIVRGKDIILIDDVTTTGATLSEARKALRKAGARSVHAYAVAH